MSHSCVAGPAFVIGYSVTLCCAKYETAAMQNVTEVILWLVQRKTHQIEGHWARYSVS
jgi:hypothetical protein